MVTRYFFAVLLWLAVSGVQASTLMYVPNGEPGQILVIDTTGDRVLSRIDELENAHGLAGSANSEYLLAGSMKPLDAQANGADKPAAVSEAGHAAHHAGDSQAESGSHVSVVHPKHGHVMERIRVRGLTHHTAISPDGRTGIAVHSGAGGISVIDLEAMKVVHEIDTGAWPNYAVFSPDGGRLYVSNAGSGSVSVLDTRKWRVKRAIRVGKKPEHMVLSGDGKSLFVANVEGDSVSEVDTRRGKVRRTHQAGRQPHGIALSADDSQLFVSAKGDNKLVRISLPDGGRQHIELRPAPYHVAYLRAGSFGKDKLYVSSRRKPLIWVIDPVTMEPTGQIEMGTGVAHQMVFQK